MILFHGSTKVIEKPFFGAGREDNDFGRAFYCTENIELAEEWACLDEKGGFVNRYHIDTEGMKLLDLRLHSDGKITEEEKLLQWLALLVANRKPRLGSPVEERGKDFLLTNYLQDLSGVDYLIGYRADDSYFSFARAFLSNTITVGQLAAAMYLGDLGLQIVIRSKRMFERICYEGSQPVDGKIYYPRRMQRDQKARESYRTLLKAESEDGIYLSELMRKKK